MSQTSQYSSSSVLPSFIKSLTSSSSSSHHFDQFETASSVIVGASHSIMDNNYSPRRSESSHRSSSTTATTKKKINRDFARSLQNDDNDDWDDKISDQDDDITYPDLTTLKFSGTAQPPLPVTRSSGNQNILKPNYKQISQDPFSTLPSLKGISSKIDRFITILDTPSIDLALLKKISWNGIPPPLRPLVWQILLGYIPTNQARRVSTLQRKRQEYLSSINLVFNQSKDQTIWHQIEIDVPRTNPTIKLYQQPKTQKSLERILYLWAIRHPLSGYVQGINDLTTPIYQVILSLYLNEPDKVETFNTELLDQELINNIELDTFWCLTKILDTIQDNYIHEQPGIIRQVNDLTNLVKRIDQSLIDHFDEQGLNFLQFSFRWMNCLLMRELNIDLIIRMWDTYIAEFPNGFNEFHVYVCLLFLMKFSDDLKEMEFQDIILYLQDLSKTQNWKVDDVELMMSELFIWQSLYKNATAHLK